MTFQTAYEHVRSLARREPDPEREERHSAINVERDRVEPGQAVRVILKGCDGEGSTGYVTIVVETLEGVHVQRDTWYGRLSFFVKWEHFVRYDPSGSDKAVHLALCEGCPPEPQE